MTKPLETRAPKTTGSIVRVNVLDVSFLVPHRLIVIKILTKQTIQIPKTSKENKFLNVFNHEHAIAPPNLYSIDCYHLISKAQHIPVPPGRRDAVVSIRTDGSWSHALTSHVPIPGTMAWHGGHSKAQDLAETATIQNLEVKRFRTISLAKWFRIPGRKKQTHYP